MSNSLGTTARRIAGGAYRRIDALGHRLAGDEGTAPQAMPPASDPTSEAEAEAKPLADAFTVPPWEPLLVDGQGVLCNICRWTGEAFAGPRHSEGAICPVCNSIARDRFLHWSFTQWAEVHPALRVIECSPRLGPEYRGAMATWFFYRTSDYDLRAHQGNLQLDLQRIDLPDDSLDVMLCAHVLEHVPDTDKALAELQRVIAPGGRLVLQVPVLQGFTAPPAEPEFHGDNTPVFWRFGFDLTARLRDHGFDTALLCTEELADAVASGQNPWTEWSGEFDVPDMLAGAIPEDLTVAADRQQSARLGIEPGYQFLTWDCRVPQA
ncbi:MAG TPA: class I SAM-dependent methyltransferase [Acidimicrobiales bacterium]